MVELYGQKYTRRELYRYIGDLSQVGGIRPFQFTDGAAAGMKGIDVRSGAGLQYTVLSDRGLDISTAECSGFPFAWRSPAGDRAPAFFEPERFQWIRTFGGGLLVTGGLDQIGMPCEDEGESYGLHGRYTSLSAEQVHAHEEWKGNSCHLVVEGKVRQAALFRENLILHRRIETPLGENVIIVKDRVENAGFRNQVHMILYHCNFGFPLVNQGTRIHAPVQAIVPRDDEAARGIDRAMVMENPSRRDEQCFFYTLKPKQGWVEVALVNKKLGRGILIRYRADTLPHFTEWKCLADGNYVVGLEPSNCELLGRKEARLQKKLVTLKPGEWVDYEIQFHILDSKKAIAEAVQKIESV